MSVRQVGLPGRAEARWGAGPTARSRPLASAFGRGGLGLLGAKASRSSSCLPAARGKLKTLTAPRAGLPDALPSRKGAEPERRGARSGGPRPRSGRCVRGRRPARLRAAAPASGPAGCSTLPRRTPGPFRPSRENPRSQEAGRLRCRGCLFWISRPAAASEPELPCAPRRAAAGGRGGGLLAMQRLRACRVRPSFPRAQRDGHRVSHRETKLLTGRSVGGRCPERRAGAGWGPAACSEDAILGVECSDGRRVRVCVRTDEPVSSGKTEDASGLNSWEVGPWAAQSLSVCLPLRSLSQSPRIKPTIGLLVQ